MARIVFTRLLHGRTFQRQSRALVLISMAVLLCAVPAFAGVTVSSPANGATVTSPVRVVASASSAYPITAVRVYVDGVSVLLTGNPIDDYIWMSVGTHLLVVQAWDSTGAIFKAPLKLYVQSAPVQPVGKIEDMKGWQWCTATLNGQPCASGLGNAISWMAPYQTSPSLDGSSAEFFIGGSTGYSNALWWNSLGGGANVTHFQYDFWVFLTQPALPESLEFDLNQSFGGMRWVFGTQCNFKDSHKWDVWDGGKKVWVPTSLNCVPFSANSWNHFVWNFERVGTKVHYISLVINGVTYGMDIYHDAESNYNADDINVAFQMDGNFEQDPYHVWLDKVTLRAW